MKKIWIFMLGGYAYCFLELLWRGKTHWSMALAGGTVLLLLSFLGKRTGIFSFMATSAVLITLTELAFGFLFNVILKANVWDYSGTMLNFRGQICLPYSLLWLSLSFPLYYVVRVVG